MEFYLNKDVDSACDNCVSKYEPVLVIINFNGFNLKLCNICKTELEEKLKEL